MYIGTNFRPLLSFFLLHSSAAWSTFEFLCKVHSPGLEPRTPSPRVFLLTTQSSQDARPRRSEARHRLRRQDQGQAGQNG